MSEFTDVNAPVVEQPVQEVAAQDNPVYAADLLPVEAPKADAQQQPKPTEVQQEKPKPAPAKTQEEIDRALSARLKDAERKVKTAIESSPDYLFGKNTIDALAAKENIPREEAIKRLQRDYEQQENQRLAENPLEMVRKIKDMIQPPKVDPEPEPQSEAPSFDEFKAEAQNLVGEAYKNGLFPDGYTVTPELIGFLYENRSNPIKIASYIAGLKNATPVENDADADAQPRRTSAPIRTTSENARQMEKDWRDVPDDDAKKAFEEMRRLAREGVKVAWGK